MLGKSVLRFMVVCGLIAGIGGLSVGSVSADEGPILYDAIYFPYVPHGDMINGVGPWYGSITIQNIERQIDTPRVTYGGVRFWVFDNRTMNRIAMNDDGYGYGNPYSFEDALEDNRRVPRYDLDPNASVTLAGSGLGLHEHGSAIAIYAIHKQLLDDPGGLGELGAPTIAGVQKQAMARPKSGAQMVNARTTDAHLSVDGYTAIPLADVAWGSQSDFCHQSADGVDSCDGTGFYRAPSGEASGFDGHSYLPIIQTNSDWNTELYLSNVDLTQVTAAQVNVTFIASDQQGYAASGQHKITETFNIPPGATIRVNVTDFVGNDWVGSAHITSTVGIATAAMRSNPAENMLMINTAAPSLGQQVADGGVSFSSTQSNRYVQYAPLVFQNYNGWNTGMSFVNIAEQPNVVNVTFYDAGGGVVSVDQRTISPQGQEFIYIPAQQDLGVGGSHGFVGSAVFTSNLPFHIAVDQVKYSTGEAMSYLASSVGASFDEQDRNAGVLSVPLIQKGMVDGSGDTSGLQVFNPDFTDSVTFELRFFDSAGAAVPPTKNAPYSMTLGPRQHASIYTMNLSEMAQNQRASAVIEVTGGGGQIVGISNNVNYSVDGDGSTAYNMINTSGQYRSAQWVSEE